MKFFRLDKYDIIQLHVVLVLFGYWFICAVLNLTIGEISQSVSISYRSFQFFVSFYVVFLCKKDIIKIQGHTLPIICTFALFFFSFRFIIDIIGGPFVNVVPKGFFLRDLLFYVVGVFFSGFALLASRKHIDINKIISISFWILFITIVCIIVNINNIDVDIEEERLNAGRGLSTLAVIRVGVMEVLVTIHLILNRESKTRKKMIIYFIGLCLGVITILISGSRGGLIALIFALLVYLLFRNREKIHILALILIIVFIVYLNIVPILEWLGEYFPVVSQRLLLTVLEGDESEREILRELAIQKIIDNPFLGYGYRLFPTEYVWSSHNGILDILQIAGVPMGVLFLYFFYVKTSLLVLKICHNEKYFFPSVLLLYSLIYSLSGGLIYSSVFWVAVALICSSYYNKNNVNIR